MIKEKTFEESWDDWFEDAEDTLPLDKLEFIKSVYKDGYYDGKNDRNHHELMKKLYELEEKIDTKAKKKPRKEIKKKAKKKRPAYAKRMTDKELAQARRSSTTGSKLLYNVVKEQAKRALLVNNDLKSAENGYPKEIKKRICDYDESDEVACDPESNGKNDWPLKD